MRNSHYMTAALMAAYFASSPRTIGRPREIRSPEREKQLKVLNEREAWNREVERKKSEKKGAKK